MKLNSSVYIPLIIVFGIWLFLLFTNTRILVKEVKVEPGQFYYVEGWGNVGDAEQSSLVCTYFNGFKVLKTVFWYSSNNILGKDSCPFIDRP